MVKTSSADLFSPRFAPYLDVGPYVDEFLVDPKVAVKKLTARIHEVMLSLTLNAPDWSVTP
jgi:hypothetical protein